MVLVAALAFYLPADRLAGGEGVIPQGVGSGERQHVAKGDAEDQHSLCPEDEEAQRHGFTLLCSAAQPPG
jgi:hypothetical protein